MVAVAARARSQRLAVGHRCRYASPWPHTDLRVAVVMALVSQVIFAQRTRQKWSTIAECVLSEAAEAGRAQAAWAVSILAAWRLAAAAGRREVHARTCASAELMQSAMHMWQRAWLSVMERLESSTCCMYLQMLWSAWCAVCMAGKHLQVQRQHALHNAESDLLQAAKRALQAWVAAAQPASSWRWVWIFSGLRQRSRQRRCRFEVSDLIRRSREEALCCTVLWCWRLKVFQRCARAQMLRADQLQQSLASANVRVVNFATVASDLCCFSTAMRAFSTWKVAFLSTKWRRDLECCTQQLESISRTHALRIQWTDSRQQERQGAVAAQAVWICWRAHTRLACGRTVLARRSCAWALSSILTMALDTWRTWAARSRQAQLCWLSLAAGALDLLPRASMQQPADLHQRQGPAGLLLATAFCIWLLAIARRQRELRSLPAKLHLLEQGSQLLLEQSVWRAWATFASDLRRPRHSRMLQVLLSWRAQLCAFAGKEVLLERLQKEVSSGRSSTLKLRALLHWRGQWRAARWAAEMVRLRGRAELEHAEDKAWRRALAVRSALREECATLRIAWSQWRLAAGLASYSAKVARRLTRMQRDGVLKAAQSRPFASSSKRSCMRQAMQAWHALARSRCKTRRWRRIVAGLRQRGHLQASPRLNSLRALSPPRSQWKELGFMLRDLEQSVDAYASAHRKDASEVRQQRPNRAREASRRAASPQEMVFQGEGHLPHGVRSLTVLGLGELQCRRGFAALPAPLLSEEALEAAPGSLPTTVTAAAAAFDGHCMPLSPSDRWGDENWMLSASPLADVTISLSPSVDQRSGTLQHFPGNETTAKHSGGTTQGDSGWSHSWSLAGASLLELDSLARTTVQMPVAYAHQT